MARRFAPQLPETYTATATRQAGVVSAGGRVRNARGDVPPTPVIPTRSGTSSVTQDEVYIGDTEPVPRAKYRVWVDTADGGVVTKVWNGSAWATVGGGGLPEAVYAIDGNLAVATGGLRYRVRQDCAVTWVAGELGTAPTGSAATVDLVVNGTAAVTLTFAAGETATENTAPGVTLAAGDLLTVDVTAVGSTVKGADLVLQVQFA